VWHVTLLVSRGIQLHFFKNRYQIDILLPKIKVGTIRVIKPIIIIFSIDTIQMSKPWSTQSKVLSVFIFFDDMRRGRLWEEVYGERCLIMLESIFIY